MGRSLEGRSALITGGSRGIGAAIAELFAAEGARIAITFASNRAAADRVVSKLQDKGAQAVAFHADAADPHAARKALEETTAAFGPLNILVHNAGVSEYLSIIDSDETKYLEFQRRHFAVNVEGVISLTKAAVPHLRDGGRIILIGSVNAHQMPFVGTGVYGATKAAVAALARGWARDFGPRQILVNAIQPGPIDTEMNPEHGGEAADHMKAMTALKRYGRPEEIAALARFLASDEASFITGATIDIDGGFSI